MGVLGWTQLGACVIGAIACVTDLRWRRIPNLLTGGGVVAALLLHAALAGTSGLIWSVLGTLVGLVLLLPVFLLRGMGAGDVKFLASLGAWVGPALIIWVALYGAVAGGVLALLVVLWHGMLRSTFGNIGLLLSHWRVAGVGPVEGVTLETSRGPRLPYAIPLTCGLVVALWLKA